MSVASKRSLCVIGAFGLLAVLAGAPPVGAVDALEFVGPTVIMKPVTALPTILPPGTMTVNAILSITDNWAQGNANITVRAKWFASLYSGGDDIANRDAQAAAYNVPTDGAPIPVTLTVPSEGVGPYFVCAWARDTANIASENAPRSSCFWQPIAVDPATISPGCSDTSRWAPTARYTRTWMRDTQKYGGVRVDFRPACLQRAAGYAGIAATDPFKSPAGSFTDYHAMTRAQVDAQFLRNLRTTCANRVHSAIALRQCTGGTEFSLARPYQTARGKVPGAKDYFRAARDLARGAFDADTAESGIQTLAPAATRPEGGSRPPK